MFLGNTNILKQLKEVIIKYSGVGSTEYQLITIIEKISRISDHLQKNKKDYSAKKGLEKLVGRRNRLLRYLAKKDINSFEQLTKALRVRTKKGRPTQEDANKALSGYLWHTKQLSSFDKVDMSYELWNWSQENSNDNEYQKLMIKIADDVNKKYSAELIDNLGVDIESSLGRIHYVNINRKAFNQLLDHGHLEKARETNTSFSLSSESISSDALERIPDSQFSATNVKKIIQNEALTPINQLQAKIPRKSQGCCIVIIDEGFDLGKSFYTNSIDLAYHLNVRNEVTPVNLSSGTNSIKLGEGDHGDRVAQLIHTFAPNSRFCLVQVKYSEQTNMIKILSKINEKVIEWANSRPVLLNISFGTNIGLHDGTHILEEAIHEFLDVVPNSFAFKSVGNEGKQKIHSVVNFSYNNRVESLRFTIKHHVLNNAETVFLTHTNDPIYYKLHWRDQCIVYDGRDKIRWEPKLFKVEDGLNVEFRRLARPDITELFLTFEGLSKFRGEIKFALEFINKANNSSKHDLRKDFPVRAWIERTATRSLAFDSCQKQGTITIPGTSDRIMTITAYDGKKVPDYCSQGPTYNNYQFQKPDLAAFGFSYHDSQMRMGSSFAAPRIVGCSAIFLEILHCQNKSLSPDKLIEFLINCSQNKQWNEAEGYGFFDYAIFNAHVR